jgi:hypothetical protein
VETEVSGFSKAATLIREINQEMTKIRNINKSIKEEMTQLD